MKTECKASTSNPNHECSCLRICHLLCVSTAVDCLKFKINPVKETEVLIEFQAPI